ncbi:MAG: metallophosphoesterase [Bacteroidota bacterium]|nr:metallophosphoesterase [Bacteroidota bacterium]
MRKLLLFTITLFCIKASLAQLSPIITAGSLWRYLDNGSDQGTIWYQTGFNDLSWFPGNAQLGYGDSDEATVVSYGPSSSSKYITTYFRKTFNVSNPAQYSSLDLQAIRDDGIIVYLNGIEVWRNNMPGGVITYTTEASSTISFGGESIWNQTSVSSSYLISGSNTIAVEIHQDDAGSSDISFDLKLSGNLSPIVTTVDRGPYLNLATSNSIIVKWRTTQACDSKVSFGASPTSLNQSISDPVFTTNHEVKVTGLNPSTIYYYAVGTNSSALTTATNQTYFKTTPIQGTKGNYKFWVVGDAGTGNNDQRNAKNGFLQYTDSSFIDGWLWLGDNAYEGGKDNEYQSNVFSNNTYENELKRITVWPAPGNHDYNNHIPFSPSPAYYDIFTLPTNAEAGGLASGTEKYYSYNYGNIHFIVLDSYDEGRNTTDPMATWLTADLAANIQPWIIAYWHHPPYTKGSHNSDNSNFLDGELVDIRENIIPIIEAGGVDLVLNGHSHCYERSVLLDGHYGSSSSLNANMLIDNTSGSYPNSCPYQKQTEISKAHKGTVYTVCGSSGKLGSTSSGWPHPVMYSYSNTILGSMLLEINDNRLDAKFINSGGTISDQFSIVKNAGKKISLNACPGENSVLHPSWPGMVEWFPLGITQDSVTVNPMVATTYYAYDPLSCIRDTFEISMLPSTNCSSIGIVETIHTNQAWVYPNLLNGSEHAITIQHLPEFTINEIYLYNMNGKKILLHNTERIKETQLNVSLPDLEAGMYLIEILSTDSKSILKKIAITY